MTLMVFLNPSLVIYVNLSAFLEAESHRSESDFLQLVVSHSFTDLMKTLPYLHPLHNGRKIKWNNVTGGWLNKLSIHPQAGSLYIYLHIYTPGSARTGK